MKLEQSIIKAQKTTGKIRMKEWLNNIFVYVENGFVRTKHNKTKTGKPKEFNINELVSKEWEVLPEEAPFCWRCHTYHPKEQECLMPRR